MRTTITIAALALALTACGPDHGDDFIARCKIAIERQLRSPSAAQYGSITAAAPNIRDDLDRRGYARVADTHDLWLATVDAPNAFGTPVRNYILCADGPDIGFQALLLDRIEDLPQR